MTTAGATGSVAGSRRQAIPRDRQLEQGRVLLHRSLRDLQKWQETGRWRGVRGVRGWMPLACRPRSFGIAKTGENGSVGDEI